MTVRSGVLVLCVAISSLAFGGQEGVNLALFQWGGIPSASSSAPDLRFSAQKAADGRADTAWISGDAQTPTWLRLEWRNPVEIHEIVLQQPAVLPKKTCGRITRYVLQYLVAGQWQDLRSGEASAAELRLRLARPCRLTALRLLVEAAEGRSVAISEFQVLGSKPDSPLDWAPAWQAAYIWSEPSLVMPNRQPVRRYFRRSFDLANPKDIREAWLLGCAHDRLAGLWLNNHLVLRDISYNGGLMREARMHAIPCQWLVEGENVLSASVDDIYESGGRGLLAELVLIDRAGNRTTIASDARWKAQEDQGQVPDWRRPGFQDSAWTACKLVAGAGGRWHWVYAVPYPVVAPDDRFEVTKLALEGRAERGGEVEVRLTLDCRAKPRRDYAVAIRLGQHSYARDHDYDLGGVVLRPETVKSSGWEPGSHSLRLRLPIPSESPREVPATLQISVPSAGAGLATKLPGCNCDSYGLHFSIPLEDRTQTVGQVVRQASPGFSRNEVRDLHGTPSLLVDGHPVAPIWWSSSYGNYRRYRDYAATGVKLFRPMVAGSPVCAPGEEAVYYSWWLAQVDRMIEAALAVDPEIRVLPALFMDPNPEMLFADPSEQMLSGRGHTVIPNLLSYPDRGQVRPTFMSQEWRRRGAEGIRRLVEHMKTRPYASRVLGLWFFAGRGGENYFGGNEFNLFTDEAGRIDARTQKQWDAGDFSAAARQTFREFLLRKYGTDAALQAAWQRKDLGLDDILFPSRFRRDEVCDLLVGVGLKQNQSLRDPLAPGVGTLPMDYYQCFAEAMIDTFAAWGKAVKEASDGRLLAGCYYGYTLAQLFTAVPGFHGHTAVARACRTPYLDLYCSPSQYDANRRAGGTYWGHNIVDSLRLHGKLWVYEQDSRTFLADIMPKTFSQRETLEVFKRDAAASLVRGSGWWWYEFANGQRGANSREWFADPELAELARHLKRVYDYALALPDRGPSSQIAVFYHGETHTAQNIFPPALPLNISLGKLTLLEGMQRIGTPFDLYNLADIPELIRRGMLDQYRMALLLNPFYLTGEERQWLEQLKGGGRTLVWLWAPGLAQVGRPLAAEHVAEVTGVAGVRLSAEPVEPTCRLTSVDHPLCQGLRAGYELAPRAFRPGEHWERFGNQIAPVPYVDPKATDPETKIVGYWVRGGEVRADMAALCVRDLRHRNEGWASVYSAVPYLSIELLRNIARWAGVHVYQSADHVMYADRHFVAVHTGARLADNVLRLPRRSAVYDVFRKKMIAAGADRIQLDVPAYSTVLYYLGDPAAFRAAVER